MGSRIHWSVVRGRPECPHPLLGQGTALVTGELGMPLLLLGARGFEEYCARLREGFGFTGFAKQVVPNPLEKG